MRITKIIFMGILFFVPVLIAQEKQEIIKVLGDSLRGKVIDGESVREVYGNVVLTQGNVVITCNQAIQYISKNNAILTGNVIVKQDSLTITTEEGFYFGNERKTRSVTGISLDDQKIILEADSGEYYFNDDKAFFQSHVVLYDSTTTMFANELTYFQKEDRAVAVGNVKIVDKSNVITSDTLEHFRKTKVSFADGDVKIRSLENNTTIFGQHLEDYPETKYTLIKEYPVLIQIDTSFTTDSTLQLDTLIIKAETMEAFRDSSNTFKAIDSVKILRGEFASVNDFTLYLRSDGKIITRKISDESNQPVLWQENSQLTGDSVTIYIKDKKINQLDVMNDAFMLSQNEDYKDRFDQTSADTIKLFFSNSKIKKVEFLGDVRSIYYLYEDSTANGLNKSSAMSATIHFDNNEVSKVKLYGKPTSEYHPENKVVGNEKLFTLPKFKFYENRPVKHILLKVIPQE
jgi:lipopolysaccharide export system protein LptA